MSDAVKALVKAQKAMGAVIKNAANPHLKSKYADLGSVLDACQSALHDNGFAIMQPCGKDEQGAFVETVLAHESGDTFASRVYLVIGKNDMQGVGSAITYARRYGLLGMAGLAPEDDDGEATKAPKGQPRQEQKPPAVTDQSITSAIDYLAEAESLADLQTRWGNLPAAVKADARVIAEKDGNKARLSKLNADLDGDNLPY
jgi:hypothetical protein